MSDETRNRTTRLRRTAAGLLLGALSGLLLLHGAVAERFATLQAGRADRAAMISARAAAALASDFRGEGDAMRGALQRWLEAHRDVKALRVANVETRSIEATTFAADLKEGPPPRRMTRAEKPVYDLAHELRANVETNTLGNTVRKPEIAVAHGAGGSLLISAPVEADGDVVGALQLLVIPRAAAVTPPPWWMAAVFALAAVLAFALLALLLRGRPPLVAVAIAVALLILTLFAYREYSTRALFGGMRAVEQRMAAAVENERSAVRALAPNAAAGSWDGDVYRRPRKVDIAAALAGQVKAIDSAAYGAFAAGSVLLLFVALGFAGRTRAALVRHRRAYAYIAPAMIGMLLLVFFPFLFGLALSFTSQNVYTVNAPLRELWVGLDNYGDILGDFTIIRHTAAGRAANYQNFYWTLFHTVLWTIANVTIGVTVGLVLALILNIKAFRLKAMYRVLLILPWAIPNYITALIWRGMFHQQFGVINQVIQIFGGQPVSWFEKPWTSFAAIVATNGWLSFPFMMVISLGALQSIPADLYEAARVDGATRWQQFRSITLPSLKPSLVPAIILSVVWTFNMFNIPYLVSAGEPAGSTEILITQAYKIAFEQYRYGYAAAYSTIIFAILLIYGVFQNRVTRATESIA